MARKRREANCQVKHVSIAGNQSGHDVCKETDGSASMNHTGEESAERVKKMAMFFTGDKIFFSLMGFSLHKDRQK